MDYKNYKINKTMNAVMMDIDTTNTNTTSTDKK